MKRLLLFLGLLLVGGTAVAATPDAWNYIPISSFTDVATPGPIMFTSATVQFVGVSVSSPAPNSYIAFFRSTSAVFTADIGTQTMIRTDWAPANMPDMFIPLHEMKNTSYTYVSKVGTARVTYWLRYPPTSKNRVGAYPGLPASGQPADKITFPQ